MSYQSTTPNFDLPQWVYSDPPQMNDFNTAFANIDEKLYQMMKKVQLMV